jgi:hypothetical protein
MELREEVLTELAIDLLYNGNSYQRKCMTHYMQNFHGTARRKEIAEFIRVQISLDKISAEMIEKAEANSK